MNGLDKTNENVPYLCGGIFFNLLSQAKQQRATAKDQEHGISDGLSDPNMMKGLYWVATDESSNCNPNSLKTNTSNFRACKINEAEGIPFGNYSIYRDFNNMVINNYDKALSRMHKFSIEFLEQYNAINLVYILLDIISEDKGISDEEEFYVQDNGMPLSKNELLKAKCLKVQPFLVGVLHFILKNRTDNKSGLNTLESWGKQAGGMLQKISPLGKNRITEVKWYEPTQKSFFEGETTSNYDQTIEEPSVIPESTSSSDSTEAEIVDEQPCSKEYQQKETVHSTTFINHVDKMYQIDYIETFNA